MGRSSAANLYDTLRNQNAGGGGAALVESLQAQLKQREGELVQVQMELGAMERSKANMAAEVNRLSQKVERLDVLETDLEQLKTAYTETEQKYQTMLTVRNLGYDDFHSHFRTLCRERIVRGFFHRENRILLRKSQIFDLNIISYSQSYV